jgi:hypothetical protein
MHGTDAPLVYKTPIVHQLLSFDINPGVYGGVTFSVNCICDLSYVMGFLDTASYWKNPLNL